MVEGKIELVAPCGMNCGVCSAYLAYSKNISKKKGKIVHCIGCRPRNKKCAYLKGHCDKLSSYQIEFCFECEEFPCARLKHIDQRYRKRYNTSLIDNLQKIKAEGINSFLEEQHEKFKCSKCGGTISIHNGKCYDCEKIESWKS